MVHYNTKLQTVLRYIVCQTFNSQIQTIFHPHLLSMHRCLLCIFCSKLTVFAEIGLSIDTQKARQNDLITIKYI